MEDSILIGVLNLWVILAWMSVMVIKTWLENQFFYIRENQKPKPNPYLEFFGGFIITLTIIIPIILTFINNMGLVD